MQKLGQPLKFDWDQGNINKNSAKHDVTDEESEEVFFDKHKTILKDPLHSGKEERYIIIGQTKAERLLFVAFTFRKNKVRIISARDLNKKEYYLYEKRT